MKALLALICLGAFASCETGEYAVNTTEYVPEYQYHYSQPYTPYYVTPYYQFPQYYSRSTVYIRDHDGRRYRYARPIHDRNLERSLDNAPVDR